MEPVVLTTQDDVTRDLKKQLMIVDGEVPVDVLRPRAMSDPWPQRNHVITVSDIAQPGGFRRFHLQQQGIKVDHDSLYNKVANFGHLLLCPSIAVGYSYMEEAPPTGGEGASTLMTVLVLLKTFLTGTLLVVPSGFRLAGIFGGCAVLICVGLLEVYCMILLVKCRKFKGSGTYGELARCLGWAGPVISTAMIVICQYGFVCAEHIYVAENAMMFLQPFFPSMEQWHLLLLMQVALIPMACVRQLKFFAFTNLIGDVIIISCVLYLFIFGIDKFHYDGPSPDLENWGSPSGLVLFFGNCIYVYEGINMILPIFEAHKDKDKFEVVLSSVLTSLTVLFVAFGVLWYGIFGNTVANVATLDLPRDSASVAVVSVLYAIACLFTTPVLFFPIPQIIEPFIFTSEWWAQGARKLWATNVFRALIMLSSAGIAAVGGTQFQNFLAVLGGLCCGPLALILPAAIHIKTCPTSVIVKCVDVFIICLGLCVTVSSTWIAIASW